MKLSDRGRQQKARRHLGSLIVAGSIALSLLLIPSAAASDVLLGAASASPVGSAEESVIRFLGLQPEVAPEVFLGMYTSSALQITADEIGQIEAWMNGGGLEATVAIAGTFMDIEFPNPEWNVPADLNAAWDQGAVPFINLAVGTVGGPRSASDVANGLIDDAIRRWATVYAQWSQGGEKRAFIAPLQEMNAGWVSYGLDPDGYKLAFGRIQRIFVEQGVSQDAVLWVFAPNGWSEPGHEFELYYPGDDAVDVVGFSAFNFGACVSAGMGWDPYEVAIEPYVDRMNLMAPDKPIFLAQTGTVAQGGDKDAWLIDSFSKLSQEPMLQAILYFNVSKTEAGAPSCDPVDWRVYNPEQGTGSQGFLDAVQILAAGEEVVEPPAPAHTVFIPLAAH